jgi:dTDP-4-amino-4,6-dideoxygalactose transaminase
MLDIRAEYPAIRTKIEAVVEDVLESQCFIGGRQVGELEARVASLLECEHTIAVSSGTDAILLALMACGVGPGDEVITTPFTFFATAGCVHRSGARPVFVDIDPETFNLDVQKVAAAVTDRTKAILPVHLFGQCADMDEILEIAERNELLVIEDAAQAIGATYRGRYAGTMGTMGCFSFYPTKNLGGFGEGGMVVTRDGRLATIARQMRNHGQSSQYLHEHIGGNFRLDTMKAGFLLAKCDELGRYTAARKANAAAYDRLLARVPQVTTPVAREHNGHCYHQYSILSDRRDDLRAFLSDAQIGSGIYYPLPLHLQPCFSYLGYQEGDLPISEDVAKRILSLPIHPMLTESDIERVARRVSEFHGGV